MAAFVQQNVGGSGDVSGIMEAAGEVEPTYCWFRNRQPSRVSDIHVPILCGHGGGYWQRGEWIRTGQDRNIREAEGDVQVLAMGRSDRRGSVVRVVNAYFQKKGRDGTYSPAEKALWDDILESGDCILAGDFSTVWKRYCTTRRDAAPLEDLIAAHELQNLNDHRVTRLARPGSDLHCVIDLTLTIR